MKVRHEKKYTFSLNNLSEVKKNINESKYSFYKSYNNRYVNSIYLDSFNYSNYEENLAGLSNRSKARLRWYSDEPFSKISNKKDIFFEIKIRKNLFGSKLIHKLNFSDIPDSCDTTSLIFYLRKVLPLDFLPYIDHCSIFSLGVSYEREYYENFTKKLRLTVDKNINFFKINSSNIFNFDQIEKNKLDYGVLEIKIPEKIFGDTDVVNFNLTEITPGRHSKYTIGINIIYK